MGVGLEIGLGCFASALSLLDEQNFSHLNFFCMMGNEQTPRCEASGSGSSSGVVKPIRSAMRRSRSVRSDVSDVSEQAATDKSETLRYLPNGLSGAHNGLLMPTRPYHSHYQNHHDNMGGVESPQWGWYITTTPPTPEMHQSPHMTASKKSDSTIQSSDSSSTTQSTTEACVPTTNLVFQGLNKTVKPNMGWPSVPL